jgi:ElaB/YqjD/DUF883 family membrane-anchored ribosome-binding protein
MKKYLTIFILTVIIVPSIALASWWNPFSWNWKALFNFVTREGVQTEIKTPENKPIENSTSISVLKEIKKDVPVVDDSINEEKEAQVKTEAELKNKIDPVLKEIKKDVPVVDDLINEEKEAQVKTEAELKTKIDPVLKEIKKDVPVVDDLINEEKEAQVKTEAELKTKIDPVLKEIKKDVPVVDDSINEEKEAQVKTEAELKTKIDPVLKEIKKDVPVVDDLITSQKEEEIQTETYVYHDYYPIILSFSDDKGNLVKHSSYNKYKGSDSSVKAKTPLKIGDEISFKIEARDPQDRQILYGWRLVYKSNPASVKYDTNNEFKHQITAEDLKGAGEMFRIAVYIKSEKDYFRYGGLYDDSTFIDYTLLP